MIRNKNFNLAFMFLIGVVLALAVVTGLCVFSPVAANAVGATAFEKSNVLDDLESMEGFSKDKFPADKDGEISVLNFIEYGYAYNENQRYNYGLYLYIYNPAQINIDTKSTKNKIQLATSYDENGAPKDYEKFSLRLCSVSAGTSDRLYYKFRVIDSSSADGKKILERVEAAERRYDVSGVELITVGENNAHEYSIATTFYFTGYAKGYGEDTAAESNLVCRTSTLDTIDLTVNQTSYKFQNSVNNARQISTAYFSVPKEYFEYGTLQKIKSEWWEYKTKEIIVVEKSELYNALLPYIGVDIGNYNSAIGYELKKQYFVTATPYVYWGYNCKANIPGERMTELTWLFSSNGKDIDDYYVSSGKLIEYLHSHPDIELLLNEIDEARAEDGYNVGYNVKEIDAGDTFDLFKFDNSKFWDKITAWLYPDIETEDIKNVSPIYEIKESDFAGDDISVARRLLIDVNDVDKIKAYYRTETAKGNIPILFRFAVSDYMSDEVVWAKDGFMSADHSNEAYMAQQTVFLDFDIIYLTFNQNGNLTIIPAASSPIDVIGAVTPPPEDRIEQAIDKLKNNDWWKWVLAIIIVILAILLLIKFVIWIFKKIFKGSKKNK